MKLLAVIPARGGSKGLPGKNLMTVGGVSLVGRAALTGRAACRAFAESDASLQSRILIDTDDESIAAEGRVWGAEAPFLRPAELAGDAVPMIDNVLFAVSRFAALPDGFDADTVLLLQPTSPLRSAEDIVRCLQRYGELRSEFPSDDGRSSEAGDCVSVVAVTPADHVPEQSLHLARSEREGASDANDEIRWAFPESQPTRRRQEFAPAFRPAGSVYVSSLASLRKHRSFFVPGETRGVVVPRERAIDIDDRTDWLIARELHRLQTRPEPSLQKLSGFPRAYDFDDLGRWRTMPTSPVLVAPPGAPLPVLLARLLEHPVELVVASTFADFLRIHEASPAPAALASDDLIEHTLALANGATAFVAPADLHPGILRAARLVGRPAI
jgi:CMP-N-acetylneuraminic acid synthetase